MNVGGDFSGGDFPIGDIFHVVATSVGDEMTDLYKPLNGPRKIKTNR